MSTTYDAQHWTQEDRRHIKLDPAKTPKRRIGDTGFNRLRWPAFVYSWFVLGAVALAFIIYSVMAN